MLLPWDCSFGFSHQAVFIEMSLTQALPQIRGVHAVHLYSQDVWHTERLRKTRRKSGGSSLSRLWQGKNLVYPHSKSSQWLYGPNQYSSRQCASQQFKHCLAFPQTPEREETIPVSVSSRYSPVAKVTQLIRAARC